MSEDRKLTGCCHCGKAGWTLTGDPGRVTACNCTLCRRYGALWAYDCEAERITLNGPTQSYRRTDLSEPALEILFCPDCASVIAWRGLSLNAEGKRPMAINTRLANPEAVAALSIRHFDGLGTFKATRTDATHCVSDLWA